MAKLSKPVDASDHILGAENAPVTLIEYGDFQCPHCGAAYPVVQEVVRQMEDQIRFVYRHFPISEQHEYAQIAAEAAESAAQQGKFWQMHNQIFSNQELLNVEHLYEFAKAIGLDPVRFDQDLQQHTYREKVRADFMSGVRSGVSGTPSFFINEQPYEGPTHPEMLIKALKEAINKTSAIDEKEGKG